MGRVLRPGGWAAFQFSNDPAVHRRRRGSEGLRIRLAALTGRGPRGQSHPAWLGGALDLRSLERTAQAAGMEVERLEGVGTIDCNALARRRAS